LRQICSLREPKSPSTLRAIANKQSEHQLALRVANDRLRASDQTPEQAAKASSQAASTWHRLSRRRHVIKSHYGRPNGPLRMTKAALHRHVGAFFFFSVSPFLASSAARILRSWDSR
jgi:hypothetical protein